MHSKKLPDGDDMKLDTIFAEAKRLKREHCGIFVRLPENLARKFPKVKEDASPPHVTTLYLGGQWKDEEDKIVAAAYAVAKETRPFEVKLAGLDYFEQNKDDQKVAFVKIVSSGLRSLNKRLRAEMKEHSVVWTDSYDGYHPHSTLKYFENLEAEFEGKVPSGSWVCRELEIWGFEKKHIIKFEG